MADKDFIVKNGLVTGANNVTIGTATYAVANGNFGIGDANPTYKLAVSGTFNATGNITQGGTRAVLNDSGTWSISVNGNAGTATKASTLAQGGGSGTGMTFNWSGQSGQPTYLWGSNDGTSHYVWTPANFNVNSASYSTSSGTANYATNAGGISTTQPIIGYSYSAVNIDYGGQGGPQIQGQGGGAAMISFHRPGSYAINLGLGTDNQLRTGGWSRGGNYVVIDSGNYNTYAPTLTGTGASGTWSISVSGTAGGVAWTNVSGRPTNLSSFTNDLGNYGSWITASGTLTGPVNSGSFCYTTQGLGVGTTYNQGAGYINATQNITAFYSDRRLKENIKPIENALEKIKQISGVTFNSNDLAETFGYTDRSEQVGVIAQEIQKVLPQVIRPAPFDLANVDGKTVSKSGENYMTVQYEKIVPLLIEGIKTLADRVEELETKLAEGK